MITIDQINDLVACVTSLVKKKYSMDKNPFSIHLNNFHRELASAENAASRLTWNYFSPHNFNGFSAIHSEKLSGFVYQPADQVHFKIFDNDTIALLLLQVFSVRSISKIMLSRQDHNTDEIVSMKRGSLVKKVKSI